MIIQASMLGGLSMYSPIINEHIRRSTEELKAMERALSSPISMGVLNTPKDFEILSAVRWILRSRRKWAKAKFKKYFPPPAASKIEPNNTNKNIKLTETLIGIPNIASPPNQ